MELGPSATHWTTFTYRLVGGTSGIHRQLCIRRHWFSILSNVLFSQVEEEVTPQKAVIFSYFLLQKMNCRIRCSCSVDGLLLLAVSLNCLVWPRSQGCLSLVPVLSSSALSPLPRGQSLPELSQFPCIHEAISPLHAAMSFSMSSSDWGDSPSCVSWYPVSYGPPSPYTLSTLSLP